MQGSTAKRRIVSNAPMAAIVLSGAGEPEQDSRFGRLLVLFMRIVAALWLCEGLMEWSSVVVTNVDGRSGLAALSTPAVAAVIFFAVINPIAAVGLWLATPWGGVIWLVTAGAQVFVLVLMPGFFDHPLITALSNIVLVSAYLALTWLVASGPDDRPRSG